MSIADAVTLLRKAESVLLVGHVRPDGDSIGCQLALAEALAFMGKRVSIQAYDPVPRMYQFLPGSEQITTTEMLTDSFDCAVLVEVPRLARCGFNAIPADTIVGIDHHPDYELNADADILDTSVAAAAELVVELIDALDVTISREMAINLLTAIVTDCGSFSYSNTTPATLEKSANLMRAGADITAITERVNRSYPEKRLFLQTDLLNSMRTMVDGTCALMAADSEMIESRGYDDELFEGMVNMPLSVETIFVSALGRQTPAGTWRFSLRSKAAIDIGSIAREFDGGGHRNAAGFRSDLPLAEIIQLLERYLKEKLN